MRGIPFNNVTIQELFLEREINYIVFDKQGYLCRLVPHDFGFALSPLDKAIGNYPDLTLVEQISDFIIDKNA